jgi:hypothetical protein
MEDGAEQANAEEYDALQQQPEGAPAELLPPDARAYERRWRCWRLAFVITAVLSVVIWERGRWEMGEAEVAANGRDSGYSAGGVYGSCALSGVHRRHQRWLRAGGANSFIKRLTLRTRLTAVWCLSKSLRTDIILAQPYSL